MEQNHLKFIISKMKYLLLIFILVISISLYQLDIKKDIVYILNKELDVSGIKVKLLPDTKSIYKKTYNSIDLPLEGVVEINKKVYNALKDYKENNCNNSFVKRKFSEEFIKKFSKIKLVEICELKSYIKPEKNSYKLWIIFKTDKRYYLLYYLSGS